LNPAEKKDVIFCVLSATVHTVKQQSLIKYYIPFAIAAKLKGTVSPDYKCLEVISIKSPLLGHVTPEIKIFLTLPLIFNGPSKFLSIRHQTHSNSPFYWNMNSINTRSILNYTECIPDCTRYIPKVSEML
jgi:hypothetical protein